MSLVIVVQLDFPLVLSEAEAFKILERYVFLPAMYSSGDSVRYFDVIHDEGDGTESLYNMSFKSVVIKRKLTLANLLISKSISPTFVLR